MEVEADEDGYGLRILVITSIGQILLSNGVSVAVKFATGLEVLCRFMKMGPSTTTLRKPGFESR